MMKEFERSWTQRMLEDLEREPRIIVTRARIALDRIGEEQLPQVNQSMPKDPFRRALAKLRFLEQVAWTPEIQTYLIRTQKPIPIIEPSLGSRLQDAHDTLAFALGGLRSIHLRPFSLRELCLSYPGPYDPREHKFLANEGDLMPYWKHGKKGVMRIANLDLLKTLANIKKAITEE